MSLAFRSRLIDWRSDNTTSNLVWGISEQGLLVVGWSCTTPIGALRGGAGHSQPKSQPGLTNSQDYPQKDRTQAGGIALEIVNRLNGLEQEAIRRNTRRGTFQGCALPTELPRHPILFNDLCGWAYSQSSVPTKVPTCHRLTNIDDGRWRPSSHSTQHGQTVHSRGFFLTGGQGECQAPLRPRRYCSTSLQLRED